MTVYAALQNYCLTHLLDSNLTDKTSLCGLLMKGLHLFCQRHKNLCVLLPISAPCLAKLSKIKITNKQLCI